MNTTTNHACPLCGVGEIGVTRPHGISVSFDLDEVRGMTVSGPCDTTRKTARGGERTARFLPCSAWAPLPLGLEYAHLCHTYTCSNPAHFVVTTRAINMAMEDGLFKTTTSGTADSCKHGHARSEFGYFKTLRNGARRRACRECERIRNAKSRKRVTGDQDGKTAS